MSQKRSRLFRSTEKLLPLFLGVLMLTFGLLKVVSPTIDGWFTVQIQQSQLPHSAIPVGKIGEIMTGLLFLLPRFRAWPERWKARICYSLARASSLKCWWRPMSTFSPAFRPTYCHSVSSLRSSPSSCFFLM